MDKCLILKGDAVPSKNGQISIDSKLELCYSVVTRKQEVSENEKRGKGAGSMEASPAGRMDLRAVL